MGVPHRGELCDRPDEAEKKRGRATGKSRAPDRRWSRAGPDGRGARSRTFTGTIGAERAACGTNAAGATGIDASGTHGLCDAALGRVGNRRNRGRSEIQLERSEEHGLSLSAKIAESFGTVCGTRRAGAGDGNGAMKHPKEEEL